MFPPLSDLEQRQFEILIQGLVNQGYGCCDGFLDNKSLSGLRNRLLFYYQKGLMGPAGIGKDIDYRVNLTIRGDVIRWLDPASENQHEKAYLQKIGRFSYYLNQTCFTNITDFEFNYAYYVRNSFYKKHLDQFSTDKRRQFSLVLYLNKNWLSSDGGTLTLFLKDGTQKQIVPEEGRVVFFESDTMEHEVHPSLNRHRISIAGWLKNTPGHQI